MNELEIKNLLNMDMEGLLDLRYELEDKWLQIYCEILIAYLQGDTSLLQKLSGKLYISDSVPLTIDQACLVKCTKLRLEIRLGEVSSKTLEEMIKLSPKAGLWRGEIHFVLARAYEMVLKDLPLALNSYQLAFKYFEANDISRKAVLALQNVVSVKSCIEPDGVYIIDLRQIYKKAKAQKEFAVAGLALNNISREYDLLGATSTALKFSNRALTYLSKGFGTHQYYMALTHRSQILFKLDRIKEAHEAYEEAMVCPLPEVQSACKVLEIMLGKSIYMDSNSQSQLTDTWQERLEQLQEAKQIKLGELEQRVIYFLSTAPMSKFELITKLYGNQLDFEVLENRLKNLISRLRKKRPDYIILVDGKYRLSEKVHKQFAETLQVVAP